MAAVSSSKAAMFTGPSALISRCKRSISDCNPVKRTLFSVMETAMASRSAALSIKSWLYCSNPKRAACSLSCKSVIRWRMGSSSRSKRRRCSSLARSLAVRSSYSLRFAASAASRSSFTFSAACKPDCAVASDKRARSSCTNFSSCAIEADCCCAVSMMRFSSASRVDKLLLAKSASWAWRSSSRWRSRVALKLCCA